MVGSGPYRGKAEHRRLSKFLLEIARCRIRVGQSAGDGDRSDRPYPCIGTEGASGKPGIDQIKEGADASRVIPPDLKGLSERLLLWGRGSRPPPVSTGVGFGPDEGTESAGKLDDLLVRRLGQLHELPQHPAQRSRSVNRLA